MGIRHPGLSFKIIDTLLPTVETSCDLSSTKTVYRIFWDWAWRSALGSSKIFGISYSRHLFLLSLPKQIYVVHPNMSNIINRYEYENQFNCNGANLSLSDRYFFKSIDENQHVWKQILFDLSHFRESTQRVLFIENLCRVTQWRVSLLSPKTESIGN